MLPFLRDYGWTIDFSGPDPLFNSTQIETVDLDGHTCHYTRNVPLSRQCAVKKHRYSRRSPYFWLLAILQVLSHFIERLVRLDGDAYMATGLLELGRKACASNRFDLICAASPPFFFLEPAHRLALAEDLPFLVFYEDPHGARDVGQFWPSEPEAQSRVLADADCAVFASPLTRERYVQAKLVPESRSTWVTDSFPTPNQIGVLPANERRHQRQGFKLVHLGNIPAWRNIDNLLRVLSALSASQDGVTTVYLENYGFLYPEALAAVQNDPVLARLVSQKPAVSYLESHQAAASADFLLIVIGSRHTDNLPSKTFEYLVHSKPLLIAGPKGNPLQSLLADMPVGVFCDIDSYDELFAGLQALIRHRSKYIDAFTTHAAQVERFSAESVARAWTTFFDQAVESHRSRRC